MMQEFRDGVGITMPGQRLLPGHTGQDLLHADGGPVAAVVQFPEMSGQDACGFHARVLVYQDNSLRNFGHLRMPSHH
ncbi:MAG: hypothetical protein EBZ67_07000 [Chitinophagia bacterium]|nr:hypothetical protein [Chitinophagia bacterium]